LIKNNQAKKPVVVEKTALCDGFNKKYGLVIAMSELLETCNRSLESKNWLGSP